MTRGKRKRGKRRGDSSPAARAKQEKTTPGGNPRRTDERPSKFPVIGVFLVSFVIRITAWYAVTTAEVKPLYDETMYLQRSLGAAGVVSAVVRGSAPPQEAKDAWYGRATFPPLHPLILALGQLSDRDDVAVSRLVNVLVSSATTLLMFALTLRLTDSRSIALVAAAMHAVYPSFVAYAHYLWTEPTFMFLLLFALLATSHVFDASEKRKAFLWAAVAGVSFGSLALIRAAGMPLLFALPGYVAWTAIRRDRWEGAGLAAVCVTAMLITLAPWQLTLRAQTGEAGLMTNVNRMSLYMGNNPFVPLELGAAFPMEIRGKVFAELQNSEQSPTRMAIDEMLSHPGTTILRMLARVRMLISPDYWAIRHAIKARYPPMSNFGFVMFSLLFIVSYWGYVALIVRGLIQPVASFRHRWLLFVVAAAMAAGPIITVARCRYHQPMLLVLLPFAAVGLLSFRETISRRRLAAAAIVWSVFVVVSATAIPVVFRWSLRPSSYYHGIASYVPGSDRGITLFEDVVVVRSRGQMPIGERLGMGFTEGNARLLFSNARVAAIEVVTENPKKPAELVLIDKATQRTVVVQAISDSYWQQFQATPIPGVEVMWSGPP